MLISQSCIQTFLFSTIVIEKTRQNKTIASILVALKEKYDLSKSEKYENLLNMMCSSKPGKNDRGENVFLRIEMVCLHATLRF